jgi:hypothetical protein
MIIERIMEVLVGNGSHLVKNIQVESYPNYLFNQKQFLKVALLNYGMDHWFLSAGIVTFALNNARKI